LGGEPVSVKKKRWAKGRTQKWTQGKKSTTEGRNRLRTITTNEEKKLKIKKKTHRIKKKPRGWKRKCGGGRD